MLEPDGADFKNGLCKKKYTKVKSFATVIRTVAHKKVS